MRTGPGQQGKRFVQHRLKSRFTHVGACSDSFDRVSRLAFAKSELSKRPKGPRVGVGGICLYGRSVGRSVGMAKSEAGRYAAFDGQASVVLRSVVG